MTSKYTKSALPLLVVSWVHGFLKSLQQLTTIFGDDDDDDAGDDDDDDDDDDVSSFIDRTAQTPPPARRPTLRHSHEAGWDDGN